MIDQAPDYTLNNNLLQPVTEECIIQTARRFDIPDLVIKAILEVEKGKVGEIRVNNNGSYDMGPMQINSIWLSKFKQHVSKEEILYNGCVNVQIGTWILKNNINQAKGDLWTGIGNYHSSTLQYNVKYKNKIYIALNKLTQNNRQNT